MAWDVEKDFFEPTRKAIEEIRKKAEEEKALLFCKFCKTSAGFDTQTNKCKCCGAYK